MMSTKFTTQGWSKAVQNHDYGDDHQRRYTSATADGLDDSKKNENVGEILNRVANPSGKDMSGRQVRKAHNTLDKDDFLKLMLTQMKNQDPMNPMQSHEMAAQLAQFTSLEQLFNVNKNLEGLSSKQDPLAKFEALNFLGKTIKSDTREIFHAVGDSANELRFNLGGDASKVKVKISDDFGQPVKEIESQNLNKGLAKIVWDGKDSRGRDVKAGRYTFSVEAENAGGQKINVQTETKGVVTGVNYTPEGPLLMVGDQKVKLQDVQKIEDDGLKNQQRTQEAAPLAPATSAEQKVVENQTEVKDRENDLRRGGVEEYQKALIKNKPEQTVEAKLGSTTMPVQAATTEGGAFGRRY